MKPALHCFILLITFAISIEITAQCPVVMFANPSFEGALQAHLPPPTWTECMPAQTPDTQPGSWGISLTPTDGTSYLGLVSDTIPDFITGEIWQEGVSQQLNLALVAGGQYSFTIDLANSSSTMGGIQPGCAELEVWGGFVACDDSSGTGQLLWNSSNIFPYDTWISDTVTFTPNQNYTWMMFRINNLGCSARPYILVDNIRPINSYNPPLLNITDSSFLVCPGAGIILGGMSTPNCTYAWSGGGFTSAVVNPIVFPMVNTVYHVELTDTITSCKSSGNITVEMATPPAQTICLVTVDSASTHNIITWEKLDKPATDSFFIYREISTNNYSQIAAIYRDSLSEYHDYGSNPNFTAYRYKISAFDSCHNTGILSPYHNTIHLQYLGGGNLSWNVYAIENQTTPVSSFDVYLDSLSNGNWEILGSVPGNQYTATDVGYNQHPNALYRISANFSYSCTATRSISSSLSNVISISGIGISNVFTENLVRIFPNPASNFLTIDYSFTDWSKGAIQLQITNELGQTIFSQNLPMYSGFQKLDVSLFASGLYHVSIKRGAHIVAAGRFAK